MSRNLGPPRQLGYVVRDVEAAMRHWTDVLGVGPFFYIEKPPIEDFRYQGEPSALDVGIALAQSGPMQIELIEQRNQAPSMYLDFLASGGEGLQHLAWWPEDYDAALERALASGATVGQSGSVGRRGRFVYLETGGHPGTIVELSEVSGGKGRFFEEIRRTADGWNGSDPVRRL